MPLSPVVKEKLFNVLSRALVMGALSPSDTTAGRAASAATGALWGAMMARNVTPDNIANLKTVNNLKVLKDVAIMGGLGAAAAGIGAVATGEDPLKAATSKAAYLGGTEALIHGLRRISRV